MKLRKRITHCIYQFYTDFLFYTRYYGEKTFCQRKMKSITLCARFDKLIKFGGLTDRTRHMLSLYKYCKMHGYNFRIIHPFPYDLSLILEPNEYNWIPTAEEIDVSIFNKKPIIIWSKFKGENLTKSEECYKHIEILERQIKKDCLCRYDVYGNLYFAEEEFCQLYHELFKPSSLLQSLIDETKSKVSCNYEACVFRFQQLLGDFYEPGFPKLDNDKKLSLMTKLKGEVVRLKQNGYFKTDKVLITSDSCTFLRYIEDLPFVFTIPGEIAHMQSGRKADLSAYMKSYVDLYMLKDAESVTLLRTDQMYDSGFPEFAANLGGHKFKKLILHE